MTKHRRPEDQIQRAVFRNLEARSAPGMLAFHVPDGRLRSRIEALAGHGVRAGVPDATAVKEDGRTFAVEIKSPGGRLSSCQTDAQTVLRSAGAVVAVPTGLDIL